jgi:hypothetical protein
MDHLAYVSVPMIVEPHPQVRGVDVASGRLDAECHQLEVIIDLP